MPDKLMFEFDDDGTKKYVSVKASGRDMSDSDRQILIDSLVDAFRYRLKTIADAEIVKLSIQEFGLMGGIPE